MPPWLNISRSEWQGSGGEPAADWLDTNQTAATWVHAYTRTRAMLRLEVDLHAYPYDTQTIEIKFETEGEQPQRGPAFEKQTSGSGG
jgi:hypothetical protein